MTATSQPAPGDVSRAPGDPASDAGSGAALRDLALASYRAARNACVPRRDWTGAVGAGELLSCMPAHEALVFARSVLRTLEVVAGEEER